MVVLLFEFWAKALPMNKPLKTIVASSRRAKENFLIFASRKNPELGKASGIYAEIWVKSIKRLLRIYSRNSEG